MQISIPCLYADYGRYIDAYRQIPGFIDCLKISQRRALLSLYEITKAEKKVKSAKVVGHMIGCYHPHGDQSAYETIKNLVWQGYIEGQGNWGAINFKENDSPAAMRYTECRLMKWVSELVFKYYKFVPWVNLELDDEPIFLPCIVPIGLIGTDNIKGSGFHVTTIPKYSLSNLLIRLKWLIENYNEKPKTFEMGLTDYPENIFGPLIEPNFKSSHIKQNQNEQLYSLLYTGEGNIIVSPNGKIYKNEIYILGKVPGFTSKRLDKDIDDKKIDIKEIKDISGNKDDPYYICAKLTTKRKLGSHDLNNLSNMIWDKYLIKTFNYKCNLIENNIPKIFSIDELLINNYNYYVDTVLNYKIHEYDKINLKLLNTHILDIVSNIIKNNNCTLISDIINIFNTNLTKQFVNVEFFHKEQNKWVNNDVELTSDMVKEICQTKTIRQLIEVKHDINKIKQELIVLKDNINNNNGTCYYEIYDMINNPINMKK